MTDNVSACVRSRVRRAWQWSEAECQDRPVANCPT